MVVIVAVALLCVTATVTFALRRDTPRPVGYSPVDQLEQKYGLADIEVGSSNGLGVDAGTAPVVGPGMQNISPDAQVQAPSPQSFGEPAQGAKVGPAPSASEVAPLQPVTGNPAMAPASAQAAVGLQGGGVSAEVVTGVLNGSVQLGL